MRRHGATAFSAQNARVYAGSRHAAAAYGNASLLDMNDAVCPDRICRAELGGHAVFRDSRHITASFAAHLGDEFARRIGLPPGPGAGKPPASPTMTS